MKRIVSILLLNAFLLPAMLAQGDSISLIQCLKAVRENAVYNPQFQVINDMADMKLANVKSGNLPSLKAYGKSWYQSDAISISMPNGFSTEVEQFQYNAGVEATQKLFDGGMVNKAKALEKSARGAEISKVEISIYQLSTQVTDLFFSSLLLNKQLAVIELKQQVLEERQTSMESAYNNGLIKRNDLEKIQSELLLIQLQKIHINKLQNQAKSSISILSGGVVSENSEFVLVESIPSVPDKVRPELIYFEAETQKLENLAGLQKVKNLPKLYAYGQAGYSYPGLNLFENQSDYYYIVGAKLSWTLYDWKQNKREVEMLRKQKDLIHVRQDEFNQKIDMASRNEEIEQQNLLAMIELDAKIIEQLNQVRKGSAKALESGSITSTDYLEDLNTEMKARIDAAAHKLELQQSLFNSKLLSGIDTSGL